MKIFTLNTKHEQEGSVLLPERVWNLLIGAPEQSSVLSYYQLPVSFTQVLHTHIQKTHIKVQYGGFISYFESLKRRQEELCFLPDSLGSSAAFPPSVCLSLSFALTETEEIILQTLQLNSA